MRGHRSIPTYFCSASAALTVFAVLLRCGGGGGGGSPPPPPKAKITLTGIGPYNVPYSGGNWVLAASPSFTLLASGSGFTTTSQIQWNGQPLATTFGDSSDIDAEVPGRVVASPGTASITVADSSSGVTSNALPLGIASRATKTAGAVQVITAAPDGSPANGDSLVTPS